MLDFISLHSIKLGIALSLSILFAQTFHFQYPYFIAMSAIISLSSTSLASISALKSRTLGTILGAIVGLALTYISKGNFVLSGLGMMFLATSLTHLNMSTSIGISGYVLSAVMLSSGNNVITYTLDRTIDTLIGGGISILVSLLIFPKYYYKKMIERIDLLWSFTFKLMNDIENNTITLSQIQNIQKQIIDFQQDYHNYQQEPFFKFSYALKDNYQIHLDFLNNIYIQLYAMNQTNESKILLYHRQQSLQLYKNYMKNYEI